MNWIRQEKRLAIYLRDGLACCYCGLGVESGESLSLDHLKAHSKGGSNSETNLVTCCKRCNSSRSNRPVASFCNTVSAYINDGQSGPEILAHVRKCARRVLPKAEAKALISRRGSAAKALETL